MTLSRQIALATPEQFDEIVSALSKKALAEGGGMRRFDSILRPVFRQMHAAGFSNDQLKALRKDSRRVFHRIRKEVQPDTITQVAPRLPPQKFVSLGEAKYGEAA
jgi:hypothetical protein